MGPLLPDDGPLGARIIRRLRGIALEAVLFVLVTLLLPLLVLGALVVDTALFLVRRKPYVAIRLVAMLWWFLFGELRGIAGLALIWLASFGRDTHRRRRRVYHLRQLWAGGHLEGVRRLFGLTWEVEGLDLAAKGNVVVLIRHASIIDNALPDTVLGKPHDLGLRFVLKRELQMIPTIDIGGRMVPTVFVRRGSGDTAAELEKLGKLGIDLGDDEGILIYPEGTRHTAAKLARAQEVIRERQPHVAPLADRLQHLLPPRLGGPIALLEQARGADVLVCGHVGLDGFEYVSDIWAGGLVGGTVKVKLWRHAAADVPEGEEALVQWLYERWFELDAWVGEQRAAIPSRAPKV